MEENTMIMKKDRNENSIHIEGISPLSENINKKEKEDKAKIVVKKKKIKCTFCKKKCSMIHFDCMCGGVFCIEHRYTHTHNCKSINEKKESSKELLEKKNPKMDSVKMTYI